MLYIVSSNEGSYPYAVNTAWSNNLRSGLVTSLSTGITGTFFNRLNAETILIF